MRVYWIGYFAGLGAACFLYDYAHGEAQIDVTFFGVFLAVLYWVFVVSQLYPASWSKWTIEINRGIAGGTRPRSRVLAIGILSGTICMLMFYALRWFADLAVGLLKGDIAWTLLVHWILISIFIYVTYVIGVYVMVRIPTLFIRE